MKSKARPWGPEEVDPPSSAGLGREVRGAANPATRQNPKIGLDAQEVMRVRRSPRHAHLSRWPSRKPPDDFPLHAQRANNLRVLEWVQWLTESLEQKGEGRNSSWRRGFRGPSASGCRHQPPPWHTARIPRGEYHASLASANGKNATDGSAHSMCKGLPRHCTGQMLPAVLFRLLPGRLLN